jgi:hypothetical protein
VFRDEEGTDMEYISILTVLYLARADYETEITGLAELKAKEV